MSTLLLIYKTDRQMDREVFRSHLEKKVLQQTPKHFLLLINSQRVYMRVCPQPGAELLPRSERTESLQRSCSGRSVSQLW